MIKKKTIRRTKKGTDPQAEQNTHTYIKKKQRERMVSKITFFLEKKEQEMNKHETLWIKKEKECLDGDALLTWKRNESSVHNMDADSFENKCFRNVVPFFSKVLFVSDHVILVQYH